LQTVNTGNRDAFTRSLSYDDLKNEQFCLNWKTDWLLNGRKHFFIKRGIFSRKGAQKITKLEMVEIANLLHLRDVDAQDLSHQLSKANWIFRVETNSDNILLSAVALAKVDG